MLSQQFGYMPHTFTVVVCEVRTGQGHVTLLFAPGLTNWPCVTRYKLVFSAIFSNF